MTDPVAPPTKSSARQIGFAVAKAAISAGLLFILFTTYDIETALRRVAGIELSGFIYSGILLLAAMVLAAWRW